MQDAVDNQSTLNEIALKLREKLEPIFIESFSEPNSQRLLSIRAVVQVTGNHKI